MSEGIVCRLIIFANKKNIPNFPWVVRIGWFLWMKKWMNEMGNAGRPNQAFSIFHLSQKKYKYSLFSSLWSLWPLIFGPPTSTSIISRAVQLFVLFDESFSPEFGWRCWWRCKRLLHIILQKLIFKLAETFNAIWASVRPVSFFSTLYPLLT